MLSPPRSLKHSFKLFIIKVFVCRLGCCFHLLIAQLFDRVVRSLDGSKFHKTSVLQLEIDEFQWLSGLVIIQAGSSTPLFYLLWSQTVCPFTVTKVQLRSKCRKNGLIGVCLCQPVVFLAEQVLLSLQEGPGFDSGMGQGLAVWSLHVSLSIWFSFCNSSFFLQSWDMQVRSTGDSQLPKV